MTDTNKYACEYFYYLLEKEESDFTLKVNLKKNQCTNTTTIFHLLPIYLPLQNSDRKIRYLRDNVMECFAEATLEFLDESRKFENQFYLIAIFNSNLKPKVQNKSAN